MWNFQHRLSATPMTVHGGDLRGTVTFQLRTAQKQLCLQILASDI